MEGLCGKIQVSFLRLFFTPRLFQQYILCFRYNLLKILQRFGEIKSFELLFHKSGVKEGEPRGYCFVEFKTHEVSQSPCSLTHTFIASVAHVSMLRSIFCVACVGNISVWGFVHVGG